MIEQPKVDLGHHQRLRAILRKHQNAAVESVPMTMLRNCATELGLLRGRELRIETEGESVILMDHLIYDRTSRGKTPMQRYLAKLPATDDPDERAVREAMARHRYSLYEFADVRPGVGIVVRDVVRGGTFFVVDIAMSQTVPTGAIMAERVLPLPAYWIPSGAGFPITPEAAWQIEQTLLPALQATEDDLSNLSPEAERELATTIVRAGFEEGSTGEVAYL